MAVDANVIFIQTNILNSASSWEMVDAELDGGYVTIHPNGYISTTLSNYNNGLSPSKYMRCIVQLIDSEVDESYNYQNLVEVFSEVVYSDLNGEETKSYDIIPVIRYGSIIDSSTQIRTVTTNYARLDQELKSGKVTCRNNTSHDITVVAVIMYRSNDLTGQLAGIGDTGGGPSTKLDITCDRSDWTINTIDDVIHITAVFPSDMPPWDSVLNPRYVWTASVAEGYPNAAIVFNRPYNGNDGTLNADWGYIVNVPIEGVRNGVVLIRLTYTGAGAHQYEYVEKRITIVNCDPTELNVAWEGSSEINGFNGTACTIQMVGHKWYTAYTFEGRTYHVGAPAVQADSLKSFIKAVRGNSVDGGAYTFDRNKDQGSLGSIVSGYNTVLYGIWNGYQVLNLDASVVVDNNVNNTANIRVVKELPLLIVNCEHTIELIPSLQEITDVNQALTVNARSNPVGCPVIKTIPNTSPFGWTFPDILSMYQVGAWGTSNPFIILNVKKSYTGIASIGLYVENGKDGEYEKISIDIAINVTVEDIQYILYTPGGDLVYNVPYTTKYFSVTNWSNAVWGTYLVEVQTTIDGGTGSVKEYVYNGDRITLEARREGKYKLQVAGNISNKPVVSTNTLEITNDYTDWKNSMKFLIKGTDELTDEVYKITEPVEYRIKLEYMGDTNISLYMNRTYGPGSYSNGNTQASQRAVYFTATTVGLWGLTIYNEVIGWSKTLHFENDYTEWLETLEAVSSTGSFTIPLNEYVYVTIPGFPTTLSITPRSSSSNLEVSGISNWQVRIKALSPGEYHLYLNNAATGLNMDVPITCEQEG